MYIGNFHIGNNRTFIIAEIGNNHNGSLNAAVELVDLACRAGADAVKFQTYRSEKRIAKNTDISRCVEKTLGIEETDYEMLKKYELNPKETREVFNYAKNLRKFNVCDISVISRGKHNLSYPINDRTKGNYIQLNLSSMPKYINNFSNILKMDSSVVRFLVFNK